MYLIFIVVIEILGLYIIFTDNSLEAIEPVLYRGNIFGGNAFWLYRLFLCAISYAVSDS